MFDCFRGATTISQTAINTMTLNIITHIRVAKLQYSAAQLCYTDCHLFTVMLSVIMLSVVRLNVVMLIVVAPVSAAFILSFQWDNFHLLTSTFPSTKKWKYSTKKYFKKHQICPHQGLMFHPSTRLAYHCSNHAHCIKCTTLYCMLWLQQLITMRINLQQYLCL
jgi:hypothetical protein